jgi:23S rRNA pseudouridine2605 synthase
LERLQKLLARAGVASRRASEQLILAGRVTVDGQTVCELGARADPATSEIAVDGTPLVFPGQTYAFILHKPDGVLSTRHDDRERRTVMDFVPEEARALVYPVGRLDLHSAGLLLLLSDGALAFRLTHPSYHIPKRYRVALSAAVGDEDIHRLQTGIELPDGLTAPTEAIPDPGDATRLTMTLYEGRKRQIRLMFQALGFRVLGLQRVAMGPLELGDLPTGAIRALTGDELAALRQAVGLAVAPAEPDHTAESAP